MVLHQIWQPESRIYSFYESGNQFKSHILSPIDEM